MDWLTQEQEFLHQRVMMDARKLSKEDLLEIFQIIHKQYLIRGRLFKELSSWVARNQITLPALDELLSSTKHSFPELEKE